MNIKKRILVLASISLLGLSACTGDKENTAPESISSQGESVQSIEESSQEPEALASESGEENSQSLSTSEQDLIKEFVKKMDDFENGTAGVSLKADILLTDFVNQA